MKIYCDNQPITFDANLVHAYINLVGSSRIHWSMERAKQHQLDPLTSSSGMRGRRRGLSRWQPVWRCWRTRGRSCRPGATPSGPAESESCWPGRRRRKKKTANKLCIKKGWHKEKKTFSAGKSSSFQKRDMHLWNDNFRWNYAKLSAKIKVGSTSDKFSIAVLQSSHFLWDKYLSEARRAHP